MKHRMTGLLTAAVVTMGFTMVATRGAEPKQSKLPTCPVMGETVDFSVSTMTKDGPVYFCCPGCIKKLKKDPAKYATEVAAQRAILAKLDHIQVTCPVSEEPIDPKIFTTVNGKKVNFCCKHCLKKYNKNPDKFRARLAASYTYQTKCPITGEAITPTVSTELADGHTVYFCCKGCGNKLKANPAKYAAALEAQGVPIDVAKIKKAAAKAGN